MSILKKAYEISLWRDIQQDTVVDGKLFSEERVAIIGADNMNSLSRALSPKFKKGINGSKELTFKMYRQYTDPVTGDTVDNLYVQMLANESKIKLKYREKWYDLIIKNIQQDSSNHTVSYTATDLFTAELSKNGYDLVLDASLMNNMGTLQDLANTVLKDTDWNVELQSEPVQYTPEQVVKLKDDSDNIVYAFYSSCKDQPMRFQYITDLGQMNSDGIYDKPVQSYVEMIGKTYTTDTQAVKYGFSFPVGYSFEGITQHKANRRVYTHKSRYNAALNKMVYSYNDGAIEGFSNTEYLSPNLIENLITNNSFKSTSGWSGSYMTNDAGLANQGATYNALVSVSAKDPKDPNGKTLVEAFQDGSFSENNLEFSPCLQVKFQKAESVLVNSGFYDNRSIIKNLAPGQKFVLLYKAKANTEANTEAPFVARVGVANYQVATGHYANIDNQKFIEFDTKLYTYNGSNDFKDYYYIIGEVPQEYSIVDEKTYQKLKTQLFISAAEGIELEFYDMQIFPYYDDPNNAGYPMLPTNQAVEANIVTEYFYYEKAKNSDNTSATGYRTTEQEYKYCAKTSTPAENYIPDFTDGKVCSVTAKQSNYFNIIQTLCEKFEVWVDFVITHDEVGHILTKTMVFKENIANPNHSGFRYGVNLKSSKRTLDSKAIVTKLIVPDGVNEFAPNGFCSIARAGGNPTGENYIYDFSYYYNFGLLDKDKTEELLERPKRENEDGLQGYYVELLEINTALKIAIDRYTALSKPLMQAEANRQVAEAGRIAASDSYEEAVDTFLNAAGYSHTDIVDANDNEKTKERQKQIENSSILQGYLQKISEYYIAWQKYIKDETTAEQQYNSYKVLNNDLLAEINRLTESKEKSNKLFYTVFGRFVQEGTWKSDDYTDNEKYYNDAYTTLKNSSIPKVSYTFSVIDVSPIEGYEDFEYDLADLTWVEDPELFGTQREEVVVTEVVYALDEPWNNSVKVQNYRDQFADLFQKVTATTQQVQYASGAWQKAAQFAEAEPARQAAFLQSALADAETKLQNAGEQSVVWDKTGITVTDLDSPNQQLRIIGGAILLRDEDNDGLGWKVGVTSKGISAKLLTAGQINTQVVSIMNNEEPYFRWDTYGISAYYFNTTADNKYLYGLDTKKGVRFDRFGIYGYNGIDGSTWHPDSIANIEQNSLFALTWDGLFLKIGQGTYDLGYDASTKTEVPFATPKWHTTTSRMGRAGKYIYNTWINGYPSYDRSLTNNPTFVKVFAIGDGEENEQLIIYDDGTLVANNVKFTGGVSWVPEASPARSIYGPIDLMNSPPDNGWLYKDIEDEDPGLGTENKKRWHKKKGPNDVLYCHTDTAGAVWEGPFLISGRSVVDTIVGYSVQDRQLTSDELDKIENWDEVLPTIAQGQYLFIRTYDLYDDNSRSSYRYSSIYYPEDGTSVNILGSYDSLEALRAEHPTGSNSDAYLIQGNLYVWSSTVNDWVDAGNIQGPAGTPALPANTSENIRVFLKNNTENQIDGPGENTTTLVSWTTTEETTSPDYPFVWTCTGNKVTEYSWGDIGNPSLNNIVQTVYYKNWTKPELWGAYANGVDQKSYATFLKLMNGKTGGLSYDDEGKLYILAEFIKSNNILVTTGGTTAKTIFSATSGSGADAVVKIAGFEASAIPFSGASWAEKLYYGLSQSGTGAGAYLGEPSSDSFLICPVGTKLANSSIADSSMGKDWKLVIGTTFGVDTNGVLYAKGAKISGNITATSGIIGGFTVSSRPFYPLGANVDSLTYGHTIQIDSNGTEYFSYPNDDSIMISPKGAFYSVGTVAGKMQGTWKLVIGKSFGVDSKGVLHAVGANISGTITATSGYLGPDATDEQKKNSFCFGEITMRSGGTPRLALYRHLKKVSGQSYYEFDEYPVVLCPYGVKASSTLVNNASANSLWVFLIGKATNGKVPFGITDRGALYASAGSIGGLTISENADEGGLTYSSTDFAMQMTKQGFSIGALKTASETGVKELDEYKSFSVDSQGAISCHSLKTPYFSLISTAQTTGTEKTFTATAMIAARSNDVESSSMDLIVSVTTSAPLYQSQIFTVSGKVDGITKSFKVRVPAGARYGSVVFYMERAEIGAMATCIPSSVTQRPMNKGSVFIGECHIGDGSKEGLNEGHLYVSAYSSIVSTGGDISTASDRHLKKNITNLDKEWDNFYESLKPSIFQYREGPSRWHFGFIAQDVENSLVTDQKQASDYAVLTKGLPGYLGLAYTEFVALNTWQILKLKPRITNAEQEIEKLKLEIQQLRTEIETLKK